MRTRHLAIGLAAVVGAVPAALAQDSRVPDPGNAAGIRSNTGISLAVPIGRVSVGPGFPNGEPIYVRRTTVGAGMTVVEVSTTPFMPVPTSNQKTAAVRSDQPASW